MLGRGVGSSLLLRLPLYARLPLRPAPFQCPHDVPSRTLFVASHTLYAKPGRPRKTVGEPSRPVKRAVKRAAKTATTTTDDAATTQVKEKKKAAAAKKPARAKKSKATEALTTEQKDALKAAKQAKAEKDKLKNLKEAALSPPSFRGPSAYNMYLSEKTKGHKRDKGASLRDITAPIVQEFKNLSPAELEHYNHLSHTATETRQAEYKHWVEKHTPEQIQLANRARTQLRRKDGKARRLTWTNIRDERKVKMPVGPYMQFSINRNASGDFKHIGVIERAKLIGQEWKALNESEKKKYKDLNGEDSSRYVSEYNDVYGHMPPSANGGQPRAAAAAA